MCVVTTILNGIVNTYESALVPMSKLAVALCMSYCIECDEVVEFCDECECDCACDDPQCDCDCHGFTLSLDSDSSDEEDYFD